MDAAEVEVVDGSTRGGGVVGNNDDGESNRNGNGNGNGNSKSMFGVDGMGDGFSNVMMVSVVTVIVVGLFLVLFRKRGNGGGSSGAGHRGGVIYQFSLDGEDVPGLTTLESPLAATALGVRGSGSGSGSGGGPSFGKIILGIVLLLVSFFSVLQLYQYMFQVNLFGDNRWMNPLGSAFGPSASSSSPSGGGGGDPSPVASSDSDSLPKNRIRFRKQVFHLPGDRYTYDDARAVCKAFGADLATYDQMEAAYGKGADWCQYGWSEGQMALFPTQKKTFQQLQRKKGYEHMCGRPGINGGFMPDAHTKYGVNCYGYKPRMNADEAEMMKFMTAVPETPEDAAFQKKVRYWKERIPQIAIAPFDYQSWGAP